MALAGWRSRRTIPRSSWGSPASSRYGGRREAARGTPGAAAGASPAPRAASPPHPANGDSPLRFAPPPPQSRALIGPQPPRHWPAELSLRATAPCPRRVARRAGSGASQRAPVARGTARSAGGPRVTGSSPAGAPRRGGDGQGPGVAPGVAWRGSVLPPEGPVRGNGLCPRWLGGEEQLWDGVGLPGAGWEAPGGPSLTRQGPAFGANGLNVGL